MAHRCTVLALLALSSPLVAQPPQREGRSAARGGAGLARARWVRTRRSRCWPTRVCAGAAGPGSRPRPNGVPCCAHRAGTGTPSATAPRVNRARSRTEPCCANPYQVVEGLAIAAFVIGRPRVFVALKASFERERERVLRAVTEMEQAGMLGELSVALVAGPEEYLFGEEKALLEVIEGNEPLPRWLPPYMHGLFATAPQLGWSAHEPEVGHAGRHESNPTLVNNVETFANVTHVLAHGVESFRSLGTPLAGTVVCTVVSDVLRDPWVVEIETGTTLATCS